MNQEKQPEALRLADLLEYISNNSEDSWQAFDEAAAELRRLHAQNTEQFAELAAEAARTAEEKLRADQMTDQHRMQSNMRTQLESENLQLAMEGLANRDRIADLEAQLSAIGAGGVESLRKRECLQQSAEVPDCRGRVMVDEDGECGISWRGGMPPKNGTNIYTEQQVRALQAVPPAPASVAAPSNRIAEALRAFDTAMEACSDYPDTSGDIDGLVKAVRKARAALAAPPAPAGVAVPKCPFPCGWENLHKLVVAEGAFLANSLREDEPITENQRDTVMRVVNYSIKMARAALAAAPAQAAYSREEWIAQAAQVFVDDGDDQKAAQDLARWHWNQQDWTSGEIDDPREVAREDLAGREKPTAPAQAAAWMTPEGDRVVTESTMAGARKDGGAMLSSLRPFTVALGKINAPAQEHATQLAGQGPAAVIVTVTQETPLKQNVEFNWAPGALQPGEHKLYLAPIQAQEDADVQHALVAERERICAAIKAEDDYCVTQGDYMLDSNDCIKVARGEWTRPVYDAAAQKGGA